ncbi:MAG: hypothetical protein IGR92_14740 [Leptolyngbyaceae cyanobacterium T60_A2020_046]|nr:hypothetical protein [Leptolyngbyaceae cyanobacterium T60_A2020_046]
MAEHSDFQAEEFAADDLAAIAQQVQRVALARRGNELALLELLRLLEQLHGQVRDDYFQEALPTNRQRLYALLRDIEVSGGWPYIQRMRLRSLLQHLEGENDGTVSS